MAYRIQVFIGDRKLVDLACNRPLAYAREEALEAIDMLEADYALILDVYAQQMDRIERSAYSSPRR